AITVSLRFDSSLVETENELLGKAQSYGLSLVTFQAEDVSRATLQWISGQPEALRASPPKNGKEDRPGTPGEPTEAAAAPNGNGKKPGDVTAEEIAGVSREAESTAYLLRARAAFFQEDYSKALRQILRSIKVEPNNPQAYAMLGSLYYRMNWTNLALKYWDKSLTFDPDNREIEDLLEQIRVGQ
ncbi:MAG: hypothetical protein IIA14_14490, partial [SAR324 cluster bacterium]|nr:hypothetical protein [SAR324 cluster bacterium]